MPLATPMAERQSIIERYEKSDSISKIAQDFKVSRGTVYRLIKRYETDGKKGLKPHYSNCGKARPGASDFIFRAVRCLRAWHSTWGGEKIHAEMLRMRPGLRLPTSRTLYRWFNWNGQIQPSSRPPKEPHQWAEQLHEGWQVDAKEKMKIADGSQNCWLNITDEHSGTAIDPPVFPL